MGAARPRLVRVDRRPTPACAAASQPFGYFWKTPRRPVDAFVRESASTARPSTAALHRQRRWRNCAPTALSWTSCATTRPGCRPASWRMDPRNGEVRAWVGSRDFQTDQFDHVAQARAPARLDLQALRLRRGVRRRACRPDRYLHRPGGGDSARPAAPSGGRPTSSPPSGAADDAARRPGVFEEHHHRAGDAAKSVRARGRHAGRSRWACARASWTRCRRWRWAPAR